jgi:hypothetical protein
MIHRSTSACRAGILLLLLPLVAEADGGWVPLFDGKSTAGWVQRGGQAVYTVEDGVLVGRTVLDTPNSFLCPSKDYADFVLEFEVWVDPKLNSGVQVRSESRPEYRGGVVHGYQVEINPSDRAWSGGIYDEQRRGWLASPKGHPSARSAFKVGEWNRYRVEAAGDRLRTWVNDVPVCDLVDGMTRSGFIGFQVHQAKEAGLAVKWRHIRLKELARVPTGLAPNTLADEERAEGWRLLWDGHTSWGWRSAKGEEFPESGWEMEDGVLSVVETGGAQSRAGGDIVTVETYHAFDLKVDFRLTLGANSGIKYYVDTELNKAEGSAIGLEFQLLDDARHPDAKAGREGNRTLASLYDLIPAPPGKAVKPTGEWNQARIVSDGRRVEHWLNGTKVLEYERGSEPFRRLVGESKYRVWPSFGEKPSGHLLLQDHGNRVDFRNVKIKLPKP